MKYYIRVGGTVFSVSKKDYIEHYKVIERWKYIRKQEKNRTISLERAMESGLPIEVLSQAKTNSLEDIVMSSIESKELMNAVNQLEQRERMIITLIYFYGYSQREVAEKMEISKTAVVHKRNRALWHLKNYLKFGKKY